MPTLARIDAHQHFWRPARGDYGWLRPDVPALAPLLRNFEPADLQPLLQAHGVAQTVLVQAAESAAETDFMLSLADATGFVGGVVGWVDLTRADSVATLERWAANPKFKGVRPMLQDLPEADWIVRAPHPEVLRALLRLRLRFDALVKPPHLAPLLQFLRAWPELPVVVDHAAKPCLSEGWQGSWASAWRQGLAEVAALPNVVCKVSGLLTECAPAQIASPVQARSHAATGVGRTAAMLRPRAPDVGQRLAGAHARRFVRRLGGRERCADRRTLAR